MKEFFQNIWDSLYQWFITDGGWRAVAGFVLTVIIGLIIIKIITAVVRSILDKTRLKGLAGNFLVLILRIVLYFTYIIILLRLLGIDTSGVVAILASGALALSLAMQTILSNFAGGMVIVGNHPFKEGDFVETAGISGTVEEVTLFNTRLRTPDNKIITVPNSSVVGSNIINYSREEKRRVDINVSVEYGSDVEKVKRVLTSVLDEHPLVLHDEDYTVRIFEQGESSLVFVCRSWVKNADYWAVFFDLKENITKRFAEDGIRIPYNKLDVNVISKDEK
ncbi:MAG: mechanosensitive ion channel family protein [Clostridia bacterium]|nr:mechanosensitive ion channel family protein [Clostridia bacterium]